jgi:hypothetical protein
VAPGPRGAGSEEQQEHEAGQHWLERRRHCPRWHAASRLLSSVRLDWMEDG